MLRQLLLTPVLLLLSLLSGAVTIDHRTAQQRAAQVFGPSTPLVLAGTGGSGQSAYYVFNAERDGQGFAIVSAEGSLLGYAEHGEFNKESLPPQVAFWLECYKEQLEMVRSGRATSYRAAVRAEKQPLVKTRWDQDEPYNNLTPTYSSSDQTYHCATGCVATAMAQILRYWASPVPTTEIPAYTSGRLSKSMPALSATTFNYSILQDSYSKSATGDAADEVARLMLYCGQAAEMDYYQSSSAVPTGRHLARYFGFNPNYSDEDRSVYSCSDWDELVYHELEEGRPVIYSGSKFTSNSGHTFIIDGYRDGLFHINWGWGGRYDGYYKLSEADPSGGGSGAGAGIGGYSFTQSAITRIQPEATAASERAMTVSTLQAQQTTLTRSSETDQFAVPVTVGIWNYTGTATSVYLGIGVYQDNELKSVVPVFGSAVALEHRTGYNQLSREVTIGAGSSSSSYLLKAVYRKTDSEPWKDCLGSDVHKIAITIDGNTLTTTSPVIDHLVVNDVKFSGSMKAGREITAKVNITNKGANHSNTIYVVIDNLLMTGAGVYIEENETDDVTLHFKVTSTGEKEVRICASNDGSQQLWSGTITIEERPTADLRCPSATISPLAGTGRVSGTTLTFTAQVNNIGSIPFDDELTFILYRLREGTNIGDEWTTKKVEQSIPAGESREVSVSFEQLEIGASYWVSLYYPYYNTLGRIFQTLTHTIEAAPSGIELPATDKAEPSAVYDLQGRRVTTDTPKKGVYIVNGRKMVIK